MRHQYLVAPLIYLFFLLLQGCSGLLFFPHKPHYHTPDELHLAYVDKYIQTDDGETLHTWWLPANKNHLPRGSILFLHGNAENISTHFANIAWLPGAGYNILALDYRGYGLSTGEPDLSGVLIDIDAAFKHLVSDLNTDNLPIFILGQSIGGALSLSFLGSNELAQEKTQAIIIDAGFESFRGIAREKLNELWLTWPLQYPLSWLITDDYDPELYLNALPAMPKLFFHSKDDIIIPYHHGQRIFELSTSPKYFVSTEGPHITTFMREENRLKALDFLEGKKLESDNN